MNNIIYKYITAYRNKITNKLFGVVSVKHEGKKKGDVLLSFLTQSFTLAPNEVLSDRHINVWVPSEIARLFSERGYDVDIINWDNLSFFPKKKYSVCIDIHNNFERFENLLTSRCVKIQFLMSSHWAFQNKAEEKRIDALKKRKGVHFTVNRSLTPSHFEKFADYIIGLGNQTVSTTYPLPNDKKIILIHPPIMEKFDFPENKDFSVARTHFLWFGGGGAILKGLDLVLEAFAELPHLQLTIIGPASYEKEFEKIYQKELNLPNITRYGRPRKNKGDAESMIGDVTLYDRIKECGAILGMSASEGCSGAILQAMEAGIYPIITPNTGIDEEAPSIILQDPTVESIKKTAEEFSKISPEKLRKLSKETWNYAETHYTKKVFTKEMENFIDNTISKKLINI